MIGHSEALAHARKYAHVRLHARAHVCTYAIPNPPLYQVALTYACARRPKCVCTHILSLASACAHALYTRVSTRVHTHVDAHAYAHAEPAVRRGQTKSRPRGCESAVSAHNEPRSQHSLSCRSHCFVHVVFRKHGCRPCFQRTCRLE